MKKRAQFGFEQAIAIIIIAALFLLFIRFFLKPLDHIEVEISSEKAQVDGNSFLLLYLKTPVGNATMSDYILYFYQTGDSELLKKETDAVFKVAFGDNTFWKSEIGEKSIQNYVSVISDPRVYETTFPLFPDSSNGQIKLRLNIYS